MFNHREHIILLSRERENEKNELFTFVSFVISCATIHNLAPRAHVPFGQHQDPELWNYQFLGSKISGVPVSMRMRALVYMASREKVDVDAFHKGI